MNINSVSFGRIVVDGEEYKDVILLQDRAVIRDLNRLHREYGTGHLIANFELEMMLREKPDVIIIGDGMYGALKVGEEAKKMVEEAGVELIIERTPKAAERYNEMSKSKRVCALLHSTC